MSMMVPQLSVHVGSEHDTFRGDRSDKHCIKEWVDRTKAYIRKQKCPISEQSEEIMSRLINTITVTHCITEKLCFECFSPGHPKHDCPKLSSVREHMEGN